ncbi:hypothetical protein [Cognatilysobacter bugurensis]|nr:hypothetical protein [Lysobacter bugurensis]
MLRPALVAVVIAAGGFASTAAAQDPAPQRDREHDHRRDDRRALADSVRRVERESRGEVLSAERVPFDGRDVNRVKFVDASGRVRIYMDDPHARRAGPPDPTRGNDGGND